MGKTVTSRFVLKGDNQLNSAFSKAQGQLNSLTKQVQRFGGIAKASIGFGVVAAMKKSVDASREFERAMAEVSTLLDDTSGIDGLSQSINDLSLQFAQAPTEEAQALYQIISAGADTAAAQITQLDAANKLALGGVTDLATAADGLTSVLNAYEGTGLTASRISDIMFETMRRGKTTIGELSQNIGNVATIASQVGVTFDELGASIATVTVSGIDTSKAVDGLRGVLNAALKQSDQTRKAAAELGIQFDVNRFKAVGLVGVLQDIANSGATESQLARLVGRVEGLTNILAQAKNNGAKFRENLAGIEKSAGATEIAVAKIADTADQKFKKLGSTINVEMTAAGDSITQALLPAIVFITENLADFINSIGREFQVTAQVGIIAFESLKAGVIGLGDSIINGPNRALNLLLQLYDRIPGVDIDFRFPDLFKGLGDQYKLSEGIIREALAEINTILLTPLPSSGLEARMKEITDAMAKLKLETSKTVSGGGVSAGGVGAGGVIEEIETSLIPTMREYTMTIQEAGEQFVEMNQFAVQAARNIQTQFADFLFDPFDQGLDGMLKGFANTLRRMVAEAASAQILRAIFGSFGGGGGFLGSLFGSLAGTRDHGGRGSPGQIYKITPTVEDEYFVPDSAGTFIPKNQLGGNSVVVNIDARQTDDPGRLLALVPVITAGIEQGILLKSRRGILNG